MCLANAFLQTVRSYLFNRWITVGLEQAQKLRIQIKLTLALTLPPPCRADKKTVLYCCVLRKKMETKVPKGNH